jgi:hypothetical protein
MVSLSWSLASGNDQSFAHDFAVDQRPQPAGARVFAEREPLTHLDGRGLVIDAY